MNRPHPLDQLVKDDSLFFLEALIPFVDYAYKKPLVLLIKYHEIKALMQCFDNHAYITECGFDCHPQSQEEMMECLCRFLPGDFAGNLKNMQQMMKMMQVMQFMNESEGADKSHDQGRNFNFEEMAKAFGAKPSWDGPPPPKRPPEPPPGNPHDKNLYDSVMSILDDQ